MRKISFLWLVPLVLALSACTIHVPYDMDSGFDFDSYRITFQVEPDDARILVDGRLVGEAYEFALPESALRLRGRRHEVVVKLEGYREELIDLRQYDSRRFTVRLRMRPLRSAITPPPPPPVGETEQPEATTVAPRPLPPSLDQAEEVSPPQSLATPVHLTILPAESSIYLEGNFWGIAPQSGKIDNLRLRPGTYTLEVVHPGYMAVKKVFEVKDKAVEIVSALKKK